MHSTSSWEEVSQSVTEKPLLHEINTARLSFGKLIIYVFTGIIPALFLLSTKIPATELSYNLNVSFDKGEFKLSFTSLPETCLVEVNSVPEE